MNPAFVSPALPLTASVFTPRVGATTSRRPFVAFYARPSHRAARMQVEAEAGEPAEAVPEPVAEVAVTDDSVISSPAESSGAPVDFAAVNDQEDDVEIISEASTPQPIINAEAIAAARVKFRVHDTDSGSPEYQIATLTTRITYMTNHLRTHPKDFASTRGLLKMVATRRKLLKYLKKVDEKRFHNIIEGLNIRVSQQLRDL